MKNNANRNTKLERAKIFLPFDALNGFQEALREKEKILVDKKILSLEEKEKISNKLLQVKKGMMIKVIYFANNEYLALEGMVSNIDIIEHKITIVNDDAIKYLMEKAPKRAYDFIFVDLWHDASDGVELYIRVKKLEALNKGSEFSYWIERTLISSIRFNIFNALYPKLKSGEIFKTENELEQMLSDSYIRELAKRL